MDWLTYQEISGNTGRSALNYYRGLFFNKMFSVQRGWWCMRGGVRRGRRPSCGGVWHGVRAGGGFPLVLLWHLDSWNTKVIGFAKPGGNISLVKIITRNTNLWNPFKKELFSLDYIIVYECLAIGYKMNGQRSGVIELRSTPGELVEVS